MGVRRTDSFTAGAGPLDSTWTQQRTTDRMNYDGSGNAIAGTVGSDCAAFDNTFAYPADHYSKVRIGNPLAGTRYVGATTRASGTTDATFNNYNAYTDGASGGGSSELAENVNGVQTVLRNYTTTFVATDWYELRSVGTVHEAFKNGASLGTHSDASHATGKPGVESWTPSVATITEWEGGDFVADGVPVAWLTA